MYMCVVLVYFLTLRISILFLKIVEGNKHRCVNKTSRDKGGACANEKWKRCNRILSEITLGRNYPSAGYLDANLVLPKWCLIHDFNCVSRGIQQNNRKRKQEQFWIILWRSLELLNRNKSQKTIPVLWQYNCLHWVLTVESSSLKLSIYMSQVMSCLFIIHID